MPPNKNIELAKIDASTEKFHAVCGLVKHLFSVVAGIAAICVMHQGLRPFFESRSGEHGAAHQGSSAKFAKMPLFRRRAMPLGKRIGHGGRFLKRHVVRQVFRFQRSHNLLHKIFQLPRPL